ncbi:MAG TPA: hypothetical protein VLF93_04950 [Candidatus Saccharimonadales bacterium]|nr:hypothetical protein [Candidatus Saccharimonadales bacterium]
MTERRSEHPQRPGGPDLEKMRAGLQELVKIRLDLGTGSGRIPLGSSPTLPPSIFTASSSPLREAMISPGLHLGEPAPQLEIADPDVLGARIEEILQSGFSERVSKDLESIAPQHVVESIGMVLILRDNGVGTGDQQQYFQLREALNVRGNALRTSGPRDPEEIARVEGVKAALDAFMGRVEGEGIPHNARFPF